MTDCCIFRHERPIGDILTDRTIWWRTIVYTGLTFHTCALMAYLFKSHVTTNMVVSISIAPTYALLHALDSSITKNYVKCHSKSHSIGTTLLTILPQFALIYSASSLFGRKISYLFAPVNTLAFVTYTHGIRFIINGIEQLGRPPHRRH